MSQDIPRAPRYREYRSAEELLANLGITAPPQAIFKPDSGIVRRGETWMPPSYRDEYADGVIAPYSIKFTQRGEAINGCAGGKARCLAAFYLSEAFPDALVVPMSKFEIPADDPNKKTIDPPTEHYAVNTQYLRRLGVAAERIVPASESTTIFEGLIEMLNMCNERGIKDAVFVTNEYNEPRARVMLEALLDKEKGIKTKLKYVIAGLREQFKTMLGVWAEVSDQRKSEQNYESDIVRDAEPIISLDDAIYEQLTGGLTITILTAEAVLTQFSSLYGRVIEQAKQGVAYQNRASLEANGAKLIEEGSYGRNNWLNAQK